MTEKNSLDIVIIGGGMVGISLAAMLPDTLSVGVIDSFPLPKENSPLPQPSFDGRSTAISFNSHQILKQHGLWSPLSTFAEPIKTVHVSDRGRWGAARFKAEDQGIEALGYVIENACLGQGLLKSVMARDSVKLLCPGKVIKLTAKTDRMNIEYQKPGSEEVFSVTASLAIIADGAQSEACHGLGIDIAVTNYSHKAIVTNVTTTLPHQGIAYERFTDHGPLALLPLSPLMNKNRSALIWTMPDHLADELIQLDDHGFLGALQKRFGYRLGSFEQVGRRDSYPLALSQANEQVRQNLVVLGNAAHSLHPVAGQGFNLALRDINALCLHIEQALKDSLPIGDLKLLHAYYHAQKIDQMATVWFSDKLPNLFATNKLPLMLLNNLGLASLDIMPSVKSSFIDFASGVRKNYYRKF